VAYCWASMDDASSDSLEHLSHLLRQFAEDRDWGQFHSPRNLVLALAGEVGELASLIQWVPDDEVERWLKDDSNRSSFEAELADVFSYLLRLADTVNIDLARVLREKIALNESRYPREQSFGSSDKYTKYE